MTALPINPTERDRERFRDLTKVMQFGLEYDRDGEDYQCPRTRSMFRLWWSVERERQLLQNLNMSQGVKLSEMAQKLEKAEESMRSLASFVGAGGYNADKVDADVFEQKIRWGIGQIMERLEKAEAELAKLREQKPVAWMDAEGDVYKDEPTENWCPPHVPLFAAPAPVLAVAVPEEWREVMTELAEDLAIENDYNYPYREKYPHLMRKYEAEMAPVYRARTLLQSATQADKEVRHD